MAALSVTLTTSAPAWLRAVLACALLALAPSALAVTVEIDGADDPNSRLEFRTFTLPDGTLGELIVIEGDPIAVVIDGTQRLEGRLIEFDPRARIIRIVGPGSFETPEQRIEGNDLEIDLGAEQLGGRDVLIVLSEIDVWGLGALRQPGQIDVQGGLFSPCARCDQEVWDYGFRARSLRIFPGDRLVAEGVTLLIRDAAVLWLPVLVLPLADGDRQPVFRIDRGTATSRARVELRWPYAAGRNALGTFTVRYEADVDPTRSAGLGGRILGGAIETAYLGGDLDHRFYSDDGSGRVLVTYRPGYLDAGAVDGRLAPRWTVVARYDTDVALGLPSVSVRLERDDDRVPGRWEYALALAAEAEGVRGRFDTQAFIDAGVYGDALVDPRTSPSYAGRTVPRQTLARLQLEPISLEGARLGPVRLDELAIDLGAFTDVSNPANRSAAARPFADGGRVRLRHAQTLTPLPLWSGATIEGRNLFEGRYYDTAERLVQWRTVLAFTQRFGNAGAITLAYDRDVNEGETPFRFDTVPLRNRSEATARLVLTPTRSIRLETSSGYTFLDTRRPELSGWQDLTTRLQLFGDRSWIGIEVSNRYELRSGEPGTIDASLTLQGRRSPVEARLQLRHVQDLRPDETGAVRTSDTRTSLTASASIERLVSLEVSGAYRPEPPLTPITLARDPWEPLDARVGVGSQREGDARPGVRAQVLVNPNDGRLTRLQLDARAALFGGRVELDAFQRFDLPNGGATDSRLRVRVFGHAELDVRGAVLLRPSYLGLEEGTARARTVTAELRDLPRSGESQWQLTGHTVYDPALAGGIGGRRNTTLDLTVGLVQERLGPVSLSVDASAQLRLADDELERTHLQRASVTFGADIAERVGVQGSMSYVATYSSVSDTFTRSDLVLDRVSVTVRATDQLFVGARVSDVWDFTRTRADRSPWNLQPELFVLWDRCCWALAGSWNTATGDIRIILTGPGAATGIEEIIETPLALPRRPLPAERP
ncbi:MAG: hypothetical protein H0U69_14975 [Trueperaceae bacterium]|nr:hypothetical protein [Trueperaceae bacterium]